MKNRQILFIFIFSILISILGITQEFYNYYQYQEIYSDESINFFQYIFWAFRALYVYPGLINPVFNIYNSVFYVLLFFGSIFFYITKSKELRLIRFFYAITLVVNLVYAIKILLNIIVFNTTIGFSGKRILMQLIGISLCLFYVFVSYKILKITSANQELDLHKSPVTNNGTITDTSKTERILHHLFDTIIVVLLSFSILQIFVFIEELNGNNLIPTSLNNQYGAFLFFILIKFLYYLFFESLLGTSPAKYLTNSRVIDLKIKKPSIGTILVRTLCRLIPFDIFSFFKERGWHDDFSKTYVVKEKNEGLSSLYIVWSFILCALVVGFYIYKNVVF